MGRHLGALLMHHCNARLVRIAHLTFALASVAFSLPASSYPVPVDFDGTIMRWNISADDDPITYAVDADLDLDSSRFSSDVDDAAVLWGSVPASYFAYAPAAPGATPQVTVNLERALDGARFSAGYAMFDEYDGDSPIHCSIHVGVDDGTTHASIAKTVLHELGHCAGLGHTLVPEAIMSYSLDKNSFALDLDDEAAVSHLYPADGSAPKLPPGCATGAPLGNGAGPLTALLLLLPLGSALAFRESRASCRSTASRGPRRQRGR